MFFDEKKNSSQEFFISFPRLSPLGKSASSVRKNMQREIARIHPYRRRLLLPALDPV
jgi:hypothetical protein